MAIYERTVSLESPDIAKEFPGLINLMSKLGMIKL